MHTNKDRIQLGLENRVFTEINLAAIIQNAMYYINSNGTKNTDVIFEGFTFSGHETTHVLVQGFFESIGGKYLRQSCIANELLVAAVRSAFFQTIT